MSRYIKEGQTCVTEGLFLRAESQIRKIDRTCCPVARLECPVDQYQRKGPGLALKLYQKAKNARPNKDCEKEKKFGKQGRDKKSWL